ncbi:MAG: hypothetical protein MK214_06250, partial [Thalassotalea sp.]|nr:hypothetical protein [Thalassotalea sp.]
SSCHLLALVSAFGKVKLFFGEIIITDPIAVYFSYRKDQHALGCFTHSYGNLSLPSDIKETITITISNTNTNITRGRFK